MVLLNELDALRETEFRQLRRAERFDKETAVITMHDGLYKHRAIEGRLSEVHVRRRVAKGAERRMSDAGRDRRQVASFARVSRQVQAAIRAPAGVKD